MPIYILTIGTYDGKDILPVWKMPIVHEHGGKYIVQ